MNLKQIAKIAILTLGVAWLNVGSAYAKNQETTSPVPPQSSIRAAQSSSFNIAQITNANSPVYGSWTLSYSIDGIDYESILDMNGYSGTMQTRYFDYNLQETQIVEQTMYLKALPEGTVLLGYNPVYPGTDIKHPTYTADDFWFTVLPDGSAEIIHCDDTEQCSPVYAQIN
jgi:hypothetical protein